MQRGFFSIALILLSFFLLFLFISVDNDLRFERDDSFRYLVLKMDESYVLIDNKINDILSSNSLINQVEENDFNFQEINDYCSVKDFQYLEENPTLGRIRLNLDYNVFCSYMDFNAINSYSYLYDFNGTHIFDLHK